MKRTRMRATVYGWMNEWMLLTSVCVFNGVKPFYAARGLFDAEVLAEHDVGNCHVSIDADDDGYDKRDIDKSICISGVQKEPIEQQTSKTKQTTKRKRCKNN
uniref:Uncharacterized protein n=1 Tax=Glossina palpalis gambiensis TaxID=67801 RepID=A0A1B0B802_9MUSC